MGLEGNQVTNHLRSQGGRVVESDRQECNSKSQQDLGAFRQYHEKDDKLKTCQAQELQLQEGSMVLKGNEVTNRQLQGEAHASVCFCHSFWTPIGVESCFERS